MRRFVGVREYAIPRHRARSENDTGFQIVAENSRSAIVRSLGAGLRTYYHAQLLHKPDQTKVLIWSSQRAHCNHFMLTGKYTRFCDHRCIHRARLVVVSLSGTRRFGTGNQRWVSQVRVCEENPSRAKLLRHYLS